MKLIDYITKILTVLAILAGIVGWFYTRGGTENNSAYISMQHDKWITTHAEQDRCERDKMTNLEARVSQLEKADAVQTAILQDLQKKQIEMLTALTTLNANTEFMRKMLEKDK